MLLLRLSKALLFAHWQATAIAASSGLSVFIRDTDGNYRAVDLPATATGQSLYLASDVLPLHNLVFAGIEIKNDTTPLSEIGVCSESTIHVHPPELMGVALYNFVRDLDNRERIFWYQAALNCTKNPTIMDCGNYAVMEWYGTDDYDSMKMLDLHGFQLEGTLHWEALPKSIEYVQLDDNAFENIDLSALRGTSVKVLSMARNEIENVDFRGLHGTSLYELSLKGNLITNLNFSGIASSNLRILNLRKNFLIEIHQDGLAGSKLKELDLSKNRIQEFPWNVLPDTNLQRLDLSANDLKRVNMKSVTKSQLQHLYLGKNQISHLDLTQLFNGKSLLQCIDVVHNPIQEQDIGVAVDFLILTPPINRLYLPFMEIEYGRARRTYDWSDWAAALR